ncbi:MAG: zinc ABC transporter substrate-binding protein, partial [Alistipes sp.]
QHTCGVDPHIWTSPRELQIMAANAYRAIAAAYPDSVKYTHNFEQLQLRLQELDRKTSEQIAHSGVSCFLIYHPALTYYARAYGLQQIAIENEGKEPTAKRLSEMIGIAKEQNINRIFYQSQFPASSVEVIAHDIHGEAIAIDPLAASVLENIAHITHLITTR